MKLARGKDRDMRVDVIILGGKWPGMKKLASAIAAKTLQDSGFLKKYKTTRIELCVALADDAAVRSLNARFRGKDKATNVLSFPQKKDPRSKTFYIGDVILARETVKEEAQAQGKAFKHHAMHLIIHGILHLIGHDHKSLSQAKKMEALETRILRSFGVKNPYEPVLSERSKAGPDLRRRRR